jgi:hypothetical protein
MDLGQMEALNRTAQRYDISKSPKNDDLRDDLRNAKAHFKEATEALKAGDYKKAEQHLRQLGFPVTEKLDSASAATAILLGVPVREGKDGAWSLKQEVRWGKGGFQPFNDLNGFAANAIMINRMSGAPGGVSNPPTEAQATQYMRDLANPANGKTPAAKDILQAASEITGGMIMHYSSAGRPNPTYGDNPNRHAFYKDAGGKVHEFGSMDDAVKAAKAGTPPLPKGEKIIPVIARSPDEWSDIASPGTRAGRYIGDCESKLYVQTRLLTEAGFTSLGSVNVDHGNDGHMLGAFKAPDGTVWITSNEEFVQVKPSDASKGVTQADLDAKVREVTAELYHVEPNFKGELDLSDFKFASAATANLKGASPTPADSIRRSTELNAMGLSEALIPAAKDASPKP